MKDDRNQVIYVGKAKRLRNRVLSYFKPSPDSERLIETNFSQVNFIDFVVTDNEREALLLESNLIKQFKPKYNVVFRDDKSFLSIAINMNEPWPRPVLTRRLGRKGTLYFGPYASARSARRMMRALKDIFPLRRCSLKECLRRTRPCLYAEMGKCSGPCAGRISEEVYKKTLDQVIMFLKGKSDKLLARLEEEMHRAVETQSFEIAAKMRDRIAAVRESQEHRYLVSAARKVNRDVFGLVVLDVALYISLLAIREGNLQEIAHYKIPANIEATGSALESFLAQFYTAQSFIPPEILLPVRTPDMDLLAELLTERSGRRVEIAVPVRGERRRLVEIADDNARNSLKVRMTDEEAEQRGLRSLQDLLGLAAPPNRIECFDISNIGGSMAVGSMAVFIGAKPAKDQYRRYRIKTVQGQDDFAMLREVMARRLRRGKKENNLPDLIVIDGGKGQLSSARAAAAEEGLLQLNFAALAKQRHSQSAERRPERVFLTASAGPLILQPAALSTQLLTGIRDEAHRFAVTYHRKLRSLDLRKDAVVKIPGIGPALRKALLRHFGTTKALRNADVNEIRAVPGIGITKAREIRNFFEKEQHNRPR